MAGIPDLIVAVLIAAAVASIIIWLRIRMLRRSLDALQSEKKALEYRIKESTVRLYKKAVKPAQRETEVGDMVRGVLSVEGRIKALRSALEWHGAKP